MQQYTITGMSCASCSARIENAVSKVSGVESCSVSLLTNSMGVEGTAAPSEIIAAVENAGYGASIKGAEKRNIPSSSVDAEELEDKETPLLRRRLIASLIFLIPLLYLSMGHMMWDWPVPAFLADNHVAMGLSELLLTGVVMVINQKFFISGFRGVIHGAPNMDTLVALGASASFLYSTVCLFAMTAAQANGDMAGVMSYMDEFYFESAAMILTLITVGKMLEARSKGRTTDALKDLMRIAPKTAVLSRDGVEVEVPVDEVQTGDIFVVRPGETIPTDGVIVEGNSAIDESALTGESIPVDKEEGDAVSAATLNQSGFLRCQATRVGEDTTLSQIIQMVSDAAATKAPIAKIADRVSSVFVPLVISIALVTTFVWLILGQSVGFALARGISVLVISCPCALGLATPVAIMVGNGIGAKNGIMFKTAVSLEETGKVETVVLDKTGTITKGNPAVTDLIPAEGVSETELLELAYSLEMKSEHPLALAIMKEAEERQIGPKEVTEFQALPGNGLTALMDQEDVFGGNEAFISARLTLDDGVKDTAAKLAEEGKTPLFFGKGNQYMGLVSVADVMKEESPEAIDELHHMGIQVVMLTGDNEKTARAIGDQAGVDDVIAGVLPNEKERVIRRLKRQGKVAMVGDGINDAPALTRADMGIAIGAGADIAIDAADVVLMKSKLTDVPAAIRISRSTLRNIHENLFWAFFYNVIGIPLAAGAWYPLFGLKLNPMFAAAAMSLSSFFVVTNALRLNWMKVHDASKDKMRKPKKTKEKSTMIKTIQIEGMMCEHCQATVTKALEAIPQVESADVSFEDGTAIVTLTGDVEDDVLKKAVEEKDYQVVSISD